MVQPTQISFCDFTLTILKPKAMNLAPGHVLVIFIVTVITNSCYTRVGQFKYPLGNQNIPSLQNSPKVKLTFNQERIRAVGGNNNLSNATQLHALKLAKLDKDTQKNLRTLPSPGKIMKKLIGHLFPHGTMVHESSKQVLKLSLDHSGEAKLDNITTSNLKENYGLPPTTPAGADSHLPPLNWPGGKLEQKPSFPWPVLRNLNLPKPIKSRSIGLIANQTGKIPSPALLQENIGVNSPQRSLSDQH